MFFFIKRSFSTLFPEVLPFSDLPGDRDAKFRTTIIKDLPYDYLFKPLPEPDPLSALFKGRNQKLRDDCTSDDFIRAHGSDVIEKLIPSKNHSTE